MHLLNIIVSVEYETNVGICGWVTGDILGVALIHNQTCFITAAAKM